MMTHPGEPLDDDGDAVQGPQLADKPVGRGTLQQNLFGPAELAVRQPWCWSGRSTAAQRLSAAVRPAGMPAVHALAGDPELTGGLGLAEASSEQLRGA
jgi:hypothetical protein